MLLFEVDDNALINLENIDSVTFGKVGGSKAVICYISGQSYIIPTEKHKEFFNKVTALSKAMHKQFTSV